MRAFLIVIVLATCLLGACGEDGSPASTPTAVRPAATMTVVPGDAGDEDASALVLDPHPVSVMFVAWSPDGQLLATSDGLSTRLWDTSGTLVAAFTADRATVTALSWAADSQTLATGDSAGIVSLWGRDGSLASRIELSNSEPSMPVASVVWSPVKPLLATGVVQAPDPATPGEQISLPATVQVWQPDGTEVHTLDIDYSFDGVVYLAWSNDGSRLAAGGNDIHVWDTGGEELFLVEGGEFDFRPSIAFAPDGDLLAFTDVAGILHIHSVAGAPPLSGGTVAVDRAVVFSPDSELIAVATDNLLIVLASEDPAGDRVNALTSGVQTAPAWSPDSAMLAVGVARRAVQVVTPAGQSLAILPGCEAMVTDVAWSPDGTRLAAGFADGQVCVWDAPAAD